jgi:hypothetical protein
LAARHERAVAIEADRFFDFIASGFIPPWTPESHEQNTVVMQIVADAAAAYAAAGYLTIVEGIVIPRWFLPPLSEALWDAGHDVAYAVLRAPLELCLARRAAIEEHVVESVWRQFEDLGEFERNAIDVTKVPPDAVADELADGLAERFRLSP